MEYRKAQTNTLELRTFAYVLPPPTKRKGGICNEFISLYNFKFSGVSSDIS